MTTQNSPEKDYDKIDKELGENHIQKVVENMMNEEMSEEDAYKNLMELHQQCCTVFAKYPTQAANFRDFKKEAVTKKKSVSFKK